MMSQNICNICCKICWEEVYNRSYYSQVADVNTHNSIGLDEHVVWLYLGAPSACSQFPGHSNVMDVTSFTIN
jgi:hypothetical protein